MITDNDVTNVQLSVEHDIIEKMKSDHAHIAKYLANSSFDNIINSSSKFINSQSKSDTNTTATTINDNYGNNNDDNDREDNDNDDINDDNDVNDHNGDGAMQESSFYKNETVPD